MSPVLVVLHAHPDDEAIFTGGTIARAVGDGWRVVLVLATDGRRGSPSVTDDMHLTERRRAETLAAADALGIHRVEFLGYGDSGYSAPVRRSARVRSTARALMPGTLAAAHVARPAAAVRDLLVEEGATVLTSYDENGIYGHIDHIRVHEIGRRSVAGTSCALIESTLDRGELRRLRAALVARGLDPGVWPVPLTEQLGLDLGHDLVAVDVRHQWAVKMQAVAAHSSQVVEASSFMGLPPGAFHQIMATEWFRTVGAPSTEFLDMLERTDAAAAAAGVPVGAGRPL
jgi:LmbE family N-acetylglucosaminyl deacetylase